MAFNHTEVLQATQYIQNWLQTQGDVALIDVALVHFSVEYPLKDVNLGFLLQPKAASAKATSGKVSDKATDKYWIVFSLKSPWTGLYFMGARAFKPTQEPPHAGWRRAFGDVGPDLYDTLSKLSLSSVSAKPNDRVVTVHFKEGASLIVELFPSRPNWFFDGGSSYSSLAWRPSKALATAPQINTSTAITASTSHVKQTDWMSGAYSEAIKIRQKAVLKTLLDNRVRSCLEHIERVEKLQNILSKALATGRKALGYRKVANAIKAVLHEYSSSEKLSQITIDDEYIKLSPELSISENMERYYNKAKKCERTVEEATVRMAPLDAELTRYRVELKRLRSIELETSDFDKLVNELQPPVTSKKITKSLKKSEKKAMNAGISVYTSAEGLRLWVGRNHKENEEIVMRLAKGNDIWLHLKARPGAHGVVQLPSGRTASLETLLDAAHLVCHYSGVKAGAKADVDYTPRKFVKRTPGAKGKKDSFNVHYTSNKTLTITVDQARITRLMQLL